MKKVFSILVIVALVVVAGFYVLNSYIYNEKQADGAQDYKTAEYMIEGQKVKLGEAGTKYFGNEISPDLDGDGREDKVFLITQNPGGSGTFYYVVAALNLPAGEAGTENGYIGSDGVFLGDRIAPQTTELSRNPRHQNVIIVNYADRAPGEPMTASPSVGKSIWLKLDLASMQFGFVAQNFEGESNI